MNFEKHHFNFTSEELTNFVKIASSIAIGVLTLFLLVKTINEVKTYSTIGENPENAIQSVITVSGKSDMDVKPDITVFTWSVEADGKTIDEAQSKSATINNKAIAYVKSKGINEADIKSIDLNTYPRYSNTTKNCAGVPTPMMESTSVKSSGGVVSSSIAMPVMPPCVNTESTIVGYTTSQSVQVKVRSIDKNPSLASDLVGGLAQIGVKVSNPTSTVDDMDSYTKAVRDQAILKARADAETLAKSLGVKLIRVTSFNENSGGGYPYAMDYMSARPVMAKASVSPDLPTGTNKITSEVTITYEIK